MTVKAALELARGLVRPVATLSLVGTLIWLSIYDKTVPEPLASLTVAALSFWFGQRRANGKPE